MHHWQKFAVLIDLDSRHGFWTFASVRSLSLMAPSLQQSHHVWSISNDGQRVNVRAWIPMQRCRLATYSLCPGHGETAVMKKRPFLYSSTNAQYSRLDCCLRRTDLHSCCMAESSIATASSNAHQIVYGSTTLESLQIATAGSARYEHAALQPHRHP